MQCIPRINCGVLSRCDRYAIDQEMRFLQTHCSHTKYKLSAPLIVLNHEENSANCLLDIKYHYETKALISIRRCGVLARVLPRAVKKYATRQLCSDHDPSNNPTNQREADRVKKVALELALTYSQNWNYGHNITPSLCGSLAS